MKKKARWQLLAVLGLFFFSMVFAPSKQAQALPDPTSEFMSMIQAARSPKKRNHSF